MTDSEVWIAAYLAAVASGAHFDECETKAYKAVEDYNNALAIFEE